MNAVLRRRALSEAKGERVSSFCDTLDGERSEHRWDLIEVAGDVSQVVSSFCDTLDGERSEHRWDLIEVAGDSSEVIQCFF